MSLFNFYNSKFWKTQPVDRSTKENIEKQDLPENFSFSKLSDVNIDVFYEFLKENYVNDFDEKFTLLYSKKFLLHVLKGSISLALHFKNKLIGSIIATKKSIRYKKEDQKTIFINFLCIKKEFRNKNFAPLLITEIRRLCNIDKYYTAIFTGGIDLPFSICTAQYYHYDLQRRKTHENNNLILHDGKNYAEITKKFMQKFDNCLLHENYASFYTESEIFYTYIYRRNGKILGIASFYILSIYNKEIDEEMKNAYLYSSAVDKEIFNEFFYGLLHCAKKQHCVSFNCLNIDDNFNLIENLRFVPGTGTLNYYLFNFGPVEKIENEKLAVVFF